MRIRGRADLIVRSGRFISADELQSQLNIVDVIGRVLPLKRMGANYKALCPFHNEKTPSFTVSEQKQIFYCFGCGVKGGAIEFVKRYYNLEFRDAMEQLAKENGIDIGTYYSSGDKEKYYAANKEAALFFFKGISRGSNPGYAYMKRRGIDDDTLKSFGIGYADQEWTSLYDYMTSKGYDEKILLELGLISEKKGKCYDKFRNRVIFPIINVRGSVVGFGGRALGDDNPKYLNSPENKIFQKKYNLYAINTTKSEIAKSGFAIMVEGYMDVISLYQHGVKNVTASLGTALTEEQAKLIKRYSENVFLSYDSDTAGRKAALRGIDILKNQGCKVKVFHVTEGKDPDEFIKAKGKAMYDQLVENAMPMIEYKIQEYNRNVRTDTAEGKIQFMRNALRALEGLSPVEKEVYANNLSGQLGISESAIRMEIKDNEAREASESGRQWSKGHYAYERERSPMDDASKEERISPLEATVLKIMYVNPQLFRSRVECHKIISHPLSRKLLHAMLASEVGGELKAMDAAMEDLNPHEYEGFMGTLDNIIVAGKEEAILNECWEKWNMLEQKKLKETLVIQISLSEGNGGEEGRKLTEKLTEINRKQKN